MYCTNCGKELVNDEAFCPSCGKNQKDNDPIESNKNATKGEEDKKRTVAFYISLLTTPLLFIIRMMEQTTERVQGAWTSYDRVAVPENIQAVMIVILVVSTCLNIGLRMNNKTPGGSKGKVTTVMLFLNILLGIVITFANGQA